MDDGTHRYGVVRHHDKRGTWYEVIDKQNTGDARYVAAFRSQDAAHVRARDLNAEHRAAQRDKYVRHAR